MRAQECRRFGPLTATGLPNPDGGDPAVPVIASIPGSFALAGGSYQLAVVATTYGTSQLNQVGPDNATLIPLGTALTANGVQLLTLPLGAYVLSVSGATGLYATITRTSGE